MFKKLSLSNIEVDNMMRERVFPEKAVKPEFVEKHEVKKPEAYKRFIEVNEKQKFREKLIESLYKEWHTKFGLDKASQLKERFLKLAEEFTEIGALIFGDLISRTNFQRLVSSYDELLQNFGNNSWIHSYVNLANHPGFLTDNSYNDAFLNPLLITLIAYQIGGPIRMVDARAKNAEPIDVKAQDNMLHIDNTPFNDEYKIILTWEKGKASGPKGQNFVIIPGTHKGARNCLIHPEGGYAYSTENGSIFVTEETVQSVFMKQKVLTGISQPAVVEVKHDKKPVTTAFAAGSLVHHRFRTEEGIARSCMILAFHRAKDNPGQFLSNQFIPESVKSASLNEFLFGEHGVGTEKEFIAALTAESDKIIEFLKALDCTEAREQGIEKLDVDSRLLTIKEFEYWKRTVTSAPVVEEKKIEKIVFPDDDISKDALFEFLGKELMIYDKHGPLDLILYEDAHEEIRKWARNRIREMSQEKIINRLEQWKLSFPEVNKSQLLSIDEIVNIAGNLVRYIDTVSYQSDNEKMPVTNETISKRNAFRSLQQLIIDLAEAIQRCDTRQAFLTTSLFMFWAIDELKLLTNDDAPLLNNLGQKLLSHYVVTAAVIDKQIKAEMNLKVNPEKGFTYADNSNSFTYFSRGNIGNEVAMNVPQASNQSALNNKFSLGR